MYPRYLVRYWGELLTVNPRRTLPEVRETPTSKVNVLQCKVLHTTAGTLCYRLILFGNTHYGVHFLISLSIILISQGKT